MLLFTVLGLSCRGYGAHNGLSLTGHVVTPLGSTFVTMSNLTSVQCPALLAKLQGGPLSATPEFPPTVVALYVVKGALP